MPAPSTGAVARSSADETRTRLIEAATRAFAQHGVHAASLLDITRQAGQRNRGAVHYHFGSREGMLVAVLEQHIDLLADRQAQQLAVARSRSDLASVVHAIIRPSVEVADLGWQGRCYLMIMTQLVEDDPASLDPAVVAVLQRTGGYDVYSLLEERMPAMAEELRAERLSLITSFILRAVADRARADDRVTPARAQLPVASFVDNLTAMAVAMLGAPLPDAS